MDIDPQVRAEWHDHHRLSRPSLAWLHDHADPGDLHPIVSAIAELRRLDEGDA